MRPARIPFLSFIILLSAVSLFGQSATVSTCGTVTEFVAATDMTAGLLTIGGQTFTISAGTTLQNQSLVTTGASLCLSAALNIAGQITSPATITANIAAHLDVCGSVSAYTAATALANGSITIGGRTIPIAANTSIGNSDLIRVGADLCLDATVNGLGQVVAPSSVTVDTTTTLSICGMVSAFTAATTTGGGSLTIAGRTFAIAAGTQITNGDLIQAGADLCLHATLNGAGQIIVPSSVTLHVGTQVTICGTVNAFMAATASSPGSITIDGRTLRIAAGTTITNSDAIRVGLTICLDATIDVHGDIIPPTSAQPDHPPVLTVPGPQSVEEGSTLRFDVSAHDDDSGDTVHIAADGVPANASFSPQDGNPAGGHFVFTPSPSQSDQTFTVRFTATDNHEATDSRTVSIRVTPSGAGANQPPVLSVPGPQFVAPHQTLTFRVAASDPDGDSVTLSASGVTPNATFDSTTGRFTFTPSDDQVRTTFPVTFTATDSKGAHTSRSVEVHVVSSAEQPRPPVLSVPPSPRFITVGTTDRFIVTATSQTPNCDTTLAASDVPPGATFDPATGIFTFTPDATQAGMTFHVTFSATDCAGLRSAAIVDEIVVGSGPQTNPSGNLCVPVSEIVFSNGCSAVRVPVTNDGDGDLSLSGITLSDGAHFRISGGPPTAIVLSPHESISIDVSFDGDGVGAHDTVVIRWGDNGSSTSEISLRSMMKRRAAAGH